MPTRGPIDDEPWTDDDGPFGEIAEMEHTPHRLMEERQRRGILLGALNVFGNKGFARATVQDLIDEAGISRATFYKYFPDREACLVALNESILVWLEREAREAIGSTTGWPSQTRAAVERLVALVSGDPRVARICGLEATLVSVGIRKRRQGSLDALAVALRRGRAHARRGDELPRTLEEFLVGGAVSLATRSIASSLPPKDLASEVAELILLHYVGATRARKLVRGG
jgi:AcrR family transcriptional regulator